MAVRATRRDFSFLTVENNKMANLISSAANLIHQQQEREAENARRAKEPLWREYLKILSRAEQPQPGDDVALATIMSELGITADQAAADDKLVRTARRQMELHQGLAAARERERVARVKLKETRERCEQEIDAADSESNSAETHARACRFAETELSKLAKRRPELFTKTRGGVPQLIEALVVPQDPPAKRSPAEQLEGGAGLE